MKVSEVILRIAEATDKAQKFADGGRLYVYDALTGASSGVWITALKENAKHDALGHILP